MIKVPELTLPVDQVLDPIDFINAELFASDYDGTQAMTYERAPGIIDVDQAYERGIGDIFGHGARMQFLAEGGHCSRTPAEIVESVIPYVDDPEIFAKITTLVHLDYSTADIIAQLNSDRKIISANVPVDIPSINQDEPQNIVLETEEFAAVTKLLVDYKLELLLKQVGKRLEDGNYWPRPVPGFVNFSRLRQADKRINSAIISAGHTDFINKTYGMWGIEQPDIYVTTETVEQLGLNNFYLPSEIAKPSPIMMEMAVQQWKRLYGLDAGHVAINQVLYVGDDIDKDQGLARNFGTEFIYIDKAAPVESWERVARFFRLIGAGERLIGNHD